jgi:hypothetical protein
MRTVYDVYHWPHPDACAEIRGEHPTVALAAYTTGHPDSPAWEFTPNGNGWILDPAQTGGKRVWGIFARQVPETDAERIELALGVLSQDGQVDGDHHKAWVIDQIVRLLAPDYGTWITRYKDGEDGPDTYGWDEGTAP